jgi:hypothetical protein
MNRGKYRVTYISDSAQWRREKFSFHIKELIMTFYDDDLRDKTIVAWCQEISVICSSKETLTMKLVDILTAYVQSKGLEWILICDQYEGLFEPSVNSEFPFNILLYISRKQSANTTKLVIAETIDNRVTSRYHDTLGSLSIFDYPSRCFNEKEFVIWCNHNCLEASYAINPKSDEAIGAFYWTGINLNYVKAVCLMN